MCVSEVIYSLLFSPSLSPAFLLLANRPLRSSDGIGGGIFSTQLSVTSLSDHGLKVDSMQANPAWPCGLHTVPHAATGRQLKSVVLLLVFGALCCCGMGFAYEQHRPHGQGRSWLGAWKSAGL